MNLLTVKQNRTVHIYKCEAREFNLNGLKLFLQKREGEHAECCGTWVGGEFHTKHLLKPQVSYVTAGWARRSMTCTDVQGSQDENAERVSLQCYSNICYVRINIPVFREGHRDPAAVCSTRAAVPLSNDKLKTQVAVSNIYPSYLECYT